MLQFQLFGFGQARFQDRPLNGFPQQRASLLLCYLLLNRQPHHRERLAAVFWSGSSGSSARKQLRNALWSLRQVMQSAGASPAEFLRVDDENIAFIPDSRFSLDVDSFECAVQNCAHLSGPELSPIQAQELATAISLYTGDLLEGVFEDWCLYDRERLRLMYLESLHKLLEFYAVRAEYERALSYGQHLLSLDHIQERVHRQVMCLYWLSGNRAAALSQYKLCSRILREELGIPPLDETRSLYDLLRGGRPGLDDWLLTHYFGSTHTNENQQMEPATIGLLLQRLQHLQKKIDETSAELQKIERLFSASSNPSSPP